MPVMMSESSWRQTSTKVFICVPLNNVPPHKVDVFTSENYIKLHYGIYIFEKILLFPIDEEKSRVVLTNDQAEFELTKQREGTWDRLNVDVSKKEAIILKQELLRKHQEKMDQKRQHMAGEVLPKLESKGQRCKKAVSVQLQLETEQQNHVKHLREILKMEALSGNYEAIVPSFRNNPTSTRQSLDEFYTPDVFRTKEKFSEHHLQTMKEKKFGHTVEDLEKIPHDVNEEKKDIKIRHRNNRSQEPTVSGEIHKTNIAKDSNTVFNEHCRQGVVITELENSDDDLNEVEFRKSKPIKDSNNIKDKPVLKQDQKLMDKITSKVKERIQAEEKKTIVPIVRGQAHIEVSFTPRYFPTPMRESTAPEEDEWLRKQAEARKASGFIAEDLRPEENNPNWLKNKGDDFFRNGNFVGAVSAYSHGIKLCPELASLYSNRAAAHIALNNFHKAIEDASQAIKLLTPVCESNRKSRIQAYVRRGTALCHLNTPKLGLIDLQHALFLGPNDEKLKQDVQRVEHLVQELNNSDEDGGFDFSNPPVVLTQ